MADRLKAGGAMHNLFNSALAPGIIAMRDSMSSRTGVILEDLAAYCEKRKANTWMSERMTAARKDAWLRSTTATESDVQDAARKPPIPKRTRDTGPIALADEPSAEWDASVPGENWLENWFKPTRNFSEPIDYRLWEDFSGNHGGPAVRT
ncbi:hypothetical protein LLEC1_01856 [Akanthomyces lecanii]|uniref:Uncharacterized protein n=1 Tax=Cordyceps confragosa TaxID=2714763 RepID=A0A179I143_CORDF|nr:hypothetical protein LLEC1_01856 [Akanthomyces lecanii]